MIRFDTNRLKLILSLLTGSILMGILTKVSDQYSLVSSDMIQVFDIFHWIAAILAFVTSVEFALDSYNRWRDD